MNQRTADAVVASVLVGLVLLGVYGAWTSYRHARAMSGMMGSMLGMGPFLYVLGTLVGVAVVGGGYFVVRERIVEPAAPPIERPDDERERPDRHTRLLDALPEDERRVLEPLFDSPGLTQVELRDRSDFSKAKVSQTVTALEKRGLLYRERQGRTYRVYPDESLTERTDPPR